jgi:hypothetical protein
MLLKAVVVPSLQRKKGNMMSFGFERLEVRRLFAAWVTGPDFTSPGDAFSCYYHMDQTGYHWEVEIGGMGMPKTYVNGGRFVAHYDETLPSHPDDPGPERQAYYDMLLTQIKMQSGANDIDFSIAELGEETFEVIATPVTTPAPADEPVLPPTEPVEPSDTLAPRPILVPDDGTVLITLPSIDTPAPHPILIADDANESITVKHPTRDTPAPRPILIADDANELRDADRVIEDLFSSSPLILT